MSPALSADHCKQQHAALEFRMPVLQDDDAAMLHEDALLKCMRQRDLAQNHRQTGDRTDDTAVVEIDLFLARSRVAGSLRYAAEAAQGINQGTIRRLLDTTRKQCNDECGPGSTWSPVPKLPVPSHGNLWSLSNSSAPPDRSLVDAFFEKHPEVCIETQPPRAGSDDDDDDDDDDSVVEIANPNANATAVKRVSPTSTVQTGITLQAESQSFGSNRTKLPAGNDNVNPYCRSKQPNHTDSGGGIVDRSLPASGAKPSDNNSSHQPLSTI
jgi:hypothetical protein